MKVPNAVHCWWPGARVPIQPHVGTRGEASNEGNKSPGFFALRVFLVSGQTTFHLGYFVFKNCRRVTMVMKVLGSYLLGA